MQFLQNSRRIARFLKPIMIIPEANPRSVSSVFQISGSIQWPNHASPSPSVLKGMDRCTHLHTPSSSFNLLMPRLSFSSEAPKLEGDPTVTVKELHDKILDSVNVKRSMPPNAWLWSLIESCQNQDDISLLFEVLQKLRRFLFEVVGKKALWKHNVLGLTPSVASAHHLLSYALEHKNSQLMEEVMTLLKTNDLPLQPGTADLVFRICHDTDKWDLLGKYSKKFSKAGVKLRKTTFDVWMDFAANRGDTESLWKADKLRSETYNQHTLSTAFSCAKGFLLESKPGEAAAVIQLICQTYGDDKKSAVSTEFKKLVNEWRLPGVKLKMMRRL